MTHFLTVPLLKLETKTSANQMSHLPPDRMLTDDRLGGRKITHVIGG